MRYRKSYFNTNRLVIVHSVALSPFPTFNSAQGYLHVNICSSTNCSRYKIGSSVVTKSRKEPQGDQAADCIEPFAMVHRSGTHLSVAQTRKTFPTVDENMRTPSGDHFRNEHGSPTLFRGTFLHRSTSQIKMSVSLMLDVARRQPSGLHSTLVTGLKFGLG